MKASAPVLTHAFTGGTRVCDEPLIHVLDDVLTLDECANIIQIAQPRMRRSQVSGAAGTHHSHGRTSAQAWVEHEADASVYAVAERISARVGLPLVHAEKLQVIHYTPGQAYRPHYDAYDLTTAKGQRYCARGGQRLVTALAYLSAVEAGGDSRFPRLGLTIQPLPGRVVIFHNCHPGTTHRDPRAYHEGCPPEHGDKWAFNLWFHVDPYWPAP